jgi:hypothetical protein
MSIANATSHPDVQIEGAPAQTDRTHPAVELLQRTFGADFSLFDGQTGQRVHASPDQPQYDWQSRAELYREVARRGRPEFVEEESPLVLLALPLPVADGPPDVAVAAFVTRAVSPAEDIPAAARVLGIDPQEAARWASAQTPWAPESLERVGWLVMQQTVASHRIRELEKETRSLSDHLAASYEEISLLYRITQNLRLSHSDEDLGHLALEGLREVLPAEGLAIQLVPVAEADESLTHRARTKSTLIDLGRCPVDDEQFRRLIEHLGLTATTQPTVVNPAITRDPSWPLPEVRQLVIVPLSEGDNLFGWLAAFNHVDNAEFGTVEANLLSSVGAILGIHSGNIELYRQQSEFLAGVVRALSSAIDAKDPYTCGHSDRVARAAVRLAQELDCDQKLVNTIYLSGLLHDIGKIGIDDQVLRKPGKLTDEEYQHIKTHVCIGQKILLDLKKLDDVLPVVLHHHESWDGKGYPSGLVGEQVPLPARIVAVADAFDAMGSDRPYRKGMPDAKIDEIFRSGAGKQWDPKVVEALFRIRDDLRKIMQGEQAGQHQAELGLSQRT